MTMNYDQVKQHWDTWAKQFGSSLRATTKSMTIKQLEIFAITQHLKPGSKILDVGCGNGYNAIAFMENIKDIHVVACDYSPEMIENAVLNAKQLKPQQRDRLRFEVADVLALPFKSEFDVVTTDRCIINLTEVALQKDAIDECAAALRPGGLFLMLENSQQNYLRQNDAREAVGLARRQWPSFNLFLDEDVLLPHCAASGLDLQHVDDFSSLHDLMLYVLLTSQDPQKEHYDEPLVMRAAELTMNLAVRGQKNAFGAFGQNRLYVFKKK